MADETIGYTIKVGGFEAVKAGAESAFSAISQGADKATEKLRRLTSSGTGTPFNAVDAARARLSERGPVALGGGGGGGGGPVPAAAGPLQYVLPQLGLGAESFGKFGVAANTAAIGTKNFSASAGEAGVAAKGAAGAVVAAGAAVVKWAADGVVAAAEEEQALNRLDRQLKVMGGGASVTARDVGNLADEIQKLTNIDSTKVVEMASSLLERNVKPEKLEAAVRVTADLAGVTGDADKAVQLLTNSMAGNVAGLNRYGAQLSNAATQAEIFAEVERLATQGAAQNAAKLDTVGGAWERLTGKIADHAKGGGRAFLSTFKVAEALNFLSNILPETTAKTVSAAEAVEQLAAAADDAEEKVDVMGQRMEAFGAAAADALTVAKDGAANEGRARRAARRETDAAIRAMAEDHAQALLQIARKEADGSLSAEGAASFRTQMEKNRAVDEAARAMESAEAEAVRLRRAETELEAQVTKTGEAFNKLEGEAKTAAVAELRAAREAAREATQRREDAEEEAEKARSRVAVAEAERETARAHTATEKRRQAERDAEDAKKAADAVREKADKERKRALELLGEGLEKERQAREQIEEEKNKPKFDRNGRRKIRSFNADESERRDRGRQAPDQTTGGEAAERNAAKAEALKAAAQDARKTGEGIAAAAQALAPLLGGVFAGYAEALKAIHKQMSEQAKQIESLRR